jgi:TrmH family RNA methyltransferase
MQHITSAQNQLFKEALKLDKKRNRTKSGLFLIEGFRECELAQKAGYDISYLIANEKALENPIWDQLCDAIEDRKILLFSDELFSRIAYRDGIANCIALAQIPPTPNLHSILSNGKLVVILESLEKPGNIGAIFRSCDAAGVDLIILSDCNTDPFNPNVVRASLGSLFTTPFAVLSNDETLAVLQKENFNIFTTWLEAETSCYSVNMKSKTALVLGSEAQGVSTFWTTNSTDNIIIPMRGNVDSMNVSTAASVVIFEAVRQQSH